MADIPTIDDLKRLLESFKSEIVRELAVELKSGKITHNTKWLRSKDIMRILNVSEGSVRNMRNSGELKYTKVKGMHFYNELDVRDMMKPNQHNR